ncbi:hypothetical protein AX14_008755 [Amanita brunnescens Koide BX004]|nr:hypothetical protein AX14_008755 [Amanita brunnescens Koide BX004]
MSMAAFMAPSSTFRDDCSSYPLLAPLDCDTKPWINSGNYAHHKSRITDPDAPTEARNYITPSTTSRKDVPVRFAKVATSRESSVNDEVDELRDDNSTSPIDPCLVKQIKERRRRNTISARKSRQRRLEQMGELEKERNDLLKVVHDYRDYIVRLREYLGRQGIPIPEPPFRSSNERFSVSSQINHI